MKLMEFNNYFGEGIISFEHCNITPLQGKSWLWLFGLIVNGARIFNYGCPCGTCGIIFEKLASPANQVCDAEAVELLGKLDEMPADIVLQRLARIFDPGIYYPMVIEAHPQFVKPGDSNDYFANEYIRLFGLRPYDQKAPDPATPYW